MEKLAHSKKLNESGQGSVEYIIVLAMVVGMFVALKAGLDNYKLGDKIKTALFEKFQNVYRFGHPDARSGIDGKSGFVKQARFSNSSSGNDSQNFRIFVNPSKR